MVKNIFEQFWIIALIQGTYIVASRNGAFWICTMPNLYSLIQNPCP